MESRTPARRVVTFTAYDCRAWSRAETAAQTKVDAGATRRRWQRPRSAEDKQRRRGTRRRSRRPRSPATPTRSRRPGQKKLKKAKTTPSPPRALCGAGARWLYDEGVRCKKQARVPGGPRERRTSCRVTRARRAWGPCATRWSADDRISTGIPVTARLWLPSSRWPTSAPARSLARPSERGESYGNLWNILPPGSNGNVTALDIAALSGPPRRRRPPANFADQLEMYDALTEARPGRASPASRRRAALQVGRTSPPRTVASHRDADAPG